MIIKNPALSEQFQNEIEKSEKETKSVVNAWYTVINAYTME